MCNLFVYKRNEEEKKGNTIDMTFGNLSFILNRKKKGKYDMMSKIYLFQFSKKYFLW